MVYYICARHGQCGKPCNEKCFLTANFFKSKMYHDTVKPERVILNQNIKGNWCQVDLEHEKIIPEEFWDKNSIATCKCSYDAICQMETARRFRKVLKK